MKPNGWRWPAAVGGGLLLALAFPPYGIWPLAVPGVALFLGALDRAGWKRGAGLGFAGGFAFFVVLIQWMRVIGPDAWLLLSAVSAGYLAVLGAVLGLLRFDRLATPFTAAAIWVAADAIRIRFPFGGFAWGRIGSVSADAPPATWIAYGGIALVTFVIVVAAGLLVTALVGGSARRVAVALPVAIALLLVGPTLPAVPVTAEVPAAIVQGNVPRVGLDFLGQRRAVLRNHVEATDQLAAQVAAGEAVQPALVLWPENSTDLDPYRDPATAALIDGAVDAIDAPTLIGAVVETDGGARLANTSIVWSPATGPGDTYVKRHPVPFGEFIPFRSLLEGWITRLDRVPRDFIAGDEIGVLQVGPARAAIAICFEIADDPIVREHVAAGGQFIAVQTNNATYGLTGQPEQQLEISRLRAMEHGRTVAIAATSGISAEITPDGVIRQQTAEFTQQVLAVDLGLSEAQTPATRYGGWVELGFVIWAAFGVGVTMLSRRRAPAPDRPERSAAA